MVRIGDLHRLDSIRMQGGRHVPVAKLIAISSGLALLIASTSLAG